MRKLFSLVLAIIIPIHDNQISRSDFLNWGIIMPLMRQSTNEYPKTENYYPHWSLEIQISQCTLSFPLFLHKILSTANVIWNSDDPSLPLSEPRNDNGVKRLVSTVTPSQWGHCRVLCVTQLLASTKLRSVSGVTSLTQTHPCILFARASFVTGNGSRLTQLRAIWS